MNFTIHLSDIKLLTRLDIMIKHIVLMKLQTTKNAEFVKQKLLTLPEAIPTIIDLEVGIDVLHSQRSYDLVLIVSFQDLNALTQYNDHPAHLSVLDAIKPLIDKTHTVDYIM